MGAIFTDDVRVCFAPVGVGAAGPSGTMRAVEPCTGHAACASSSVGRRDRGGDCARAGVGKARPRLCVCLCLLGRRRTTVSFDVLAKGRDGEVVMPLQVHSISSTTAAAGCSTASTASFAEALLLGLGGRGQFCGDSGTEGAYVGAMEMECRRRVCAGFARVIAGSRPRGRCWLARCGEYCGGARQPAVGVLTDLNVDGTSLDAAVLSESPADDSTSARASWTWIESLEMPRSAFGRVRARLRGRKGCGQKNEVSQSTGDIESVQMMRPHLRDGGADAMSRHLGGRGQRSRREQARQKQNQRKEKSEEQEEEEERTVAVGEACQSFQPESPTATAVIAEPGQR